MTLNGPDIEFWRGVTEQGRGVCVSGKEIVMPLAIVVVAVMVGLICLLGVSCSRRSSKGDDTQRPITRQIMRFLSREQLIEELRTLEAREAPEPKMGAMCYEMASPPARAEYVCPKCAEKTLYSSGITQFVAWELDACRREFNSLQYLSDLSLSLDESSFCAHCSPSAASQALALVVRHTDGSSHTNARITHEDLRILGAFLKGHLEYMTSNEGTRPLKEKLPRLRVLLGIDPEGGERGEVMARIDVRAVLGVEPGGEEVKRQTDER
jgi:hypothetical protein